MSHGGEKASSPLCLQPWTVAPDGTLFPDWLPGSLPGMLGSMAMILSFTGFRGQELVYNKTLPQRRGSSTHVAGKFPLLWPRPPLGRSGRRQGQTQDRKPLYFSNPTSLPVELEELTVILFCQESQKHASWTLGRSRGWVTLPQKTALPRVGRLLVSIVSRIQSPVT